MALRFLYHTTLGRIILKLLTKPAISQACGRFLDSKYSCKLIPGFIENNDIDMSEYIEEPYHCFNDCFSRSIKPECRPINMEKDAFIAPCDGLLSAYRIEDGLVIPVKESQYSMADLLRDEELAKEFDGGYCLVFRLCVTHYHRYSYLDNGVKTGNTFLPGILHTVRPIALRSVPVFTENSREYTVIDSENFGKLLQMEVGAMLVGKISNYHGAGECKKGQEKGKFLYGGSTIIVLTQKDQVKISNKVLMTESMKYNYKALKENKEIVVTGKCSLNERVDTRKQSARKIKAKKAIEEKKEDIKK